VKDLMNRIDLCAMILAASEIVRNDPRSYAPDPDPDPEFFGKPAFRFGGWSPNPQQIEILKTFLKNK
jgi:hypothetical protein